MESARHTQRSKWVQTKTASHYSCARRCFAPHVALTRPPLSRFALHFARLYGYLDSGFIVRISRNYPTTNLGTIIF